MRFRTILTPFLHCESLKNSREDILRDVITFINENYGKRKEIEAARAAAVERRKAESVRQDGDTAAGSGGSENTGGGERGTEETPTLTHDEAISLIARMEERVNVAPEMELTIENLDAQFGEDGRVVTPIGEVKMGENQFAKLMRQGREGKLGMVKPTLETPDVIIEDASEAKDGDVAERKSSYVFVKAFKKADGSRYYYFTSVTVSKDGKEVVISNQEKRKNAIANLLTNGKLVWKHADDVSAASDVEQGLYSSQGNMSDPTTEGTDAPQTNVLSASKGGENSATVQEKTVKDAENQVASGVKGVHSDTYKRIIELADTYTKEVAEHENDYEWKDSYDDYSKRVEPLAETLTDEALKELYNELEERHDGLSMWIVDILEGRRVMSMRKRVDEQAESNKKALSKVKMELDAMTSLVDGFSNAVYLGTMPDSTRQDGVLNHYFAYPINYNGKRSYVFCRALHDNNTNRLYVHEVFIEDKIKKGNTLQTAASQPHGGISLYRDILANVLLSDGKDKRVPYKNKPSLLERWSVDGSTTISPAE